MGASAQEEFESPAVVSNRDRAAVQMSRPELRVRMIATALEWMSGGAAAVVGLKHWKWRPHALDRNNITGLPRYVPSVEARTGQPRERKAVSTFHLELKFARSSPCDAPQHGLP